MKDNPATSHVWEYCYLLSLTIAVFLLCYFAQILPSIVIYALTVGVIIGIVVTWKIKLSKKLLYYNNLLLLTASTCLAYLLIVYLVKSTDSMIGIILGVAAMDVYSFMKAGRHTLNAKLMSNTNSLARLSICLPVPKKPGLQPIVGVGDLYYYSIITLYAIKQAELTGGIIAFLTLLLGQIVNIFTISEMKKRHWVKGFPATLFPGLFFILTTIFKLY